MSQLALVIDLNVCVGCHACVTSCKEWNTSGTAGYMADMNPFSKDPTGTFFNRVQSFEIGAYPNTELVHFPKSCLHCEEPPCADVCPDEAIAKRSDGIVVMDYELCSGCQACIEACPYDAIDFDDDKSIAQKCNLCHHRVDRGLIPACADNVCLAHCIHFRDPIGKPK